MQIIEFILHIDEHLRVFLIDYGSWVYLILFAIIFIETGVVIMPFLPGDSLLFAAGMLAAAPGEGASLSITAIVPLLIAAAFLGDTMNYLIGKYAGEKALGLTIFGRRFVHQKHIEKTNDFFEKYGPATIIMARFMPIIRTLAPFVAGVGKMRYGTFLVYNMIGAILWVVSLTLLGYFLGNIPIVRDSFDKVILIIIFISILPIIISLFKKKKPAMANGQAKP